MKRWMYQAACAFGLGFLVLAPGVGCNRLPAGLAPALNDMMGGDESSETFESINAGDETGQPVPEMGMPVRFMVENQSGQVASVNVRLFVGEFEARTVGLSLAADQVSDTVGPDLADRIVMDVELADGTAFSPQELVANDDFIEDETVVLTIRDPQRIDPCELDPESCGPVCGDSECNGDETYSTCPEDCEPESGFGTIVGTVKDAESGSPLGDVFIEVTEASATVTTAMSDADGSFSIEIPAGTTHDLVASKSGYLPETYFNVTVPEDDVNYLDLLELTPEGSSAGGSVSGTIVSALDGLGVGELTLDLRRGVNATTGEVIASTTTAADGSYFIEALPAGTYTAQISGEGSATGYITVTSLADTTTDGQDGTITPLLSEGETRIIMNWGTEPSDLDSHLVGLLPDGSSFHVYYANREHIYAGATYAELDVDDTSSFGPETITILQDLPENYTYYVLDFSNRGFQDSAALSNSGARVQVYGSEGLIATFNVPANRTGTIWTVFSIVDGELQTINTVGEDAPTVTARTASDALTAPHPLPAKLPTKP